MVRNKISVRAFTPKTNSQKLQVVLGQYMLQIITELRAWMVKKQFQRINFQVSGRKINVVIFQTLG